LEVDWTWLVVGFLIGWLLEWAIDWYWWRRQGGRPAGDDIGRAGGDQAGGDQAGGDQTEVVARLTEENAELRSRLDALTGEPR
jgi:hypothetical protein